MSTGDGGSESVSAGSGKTAEVAKPPAGSPERPTSKTLALTVHVTEEDGSITTYPAGTHPPKAVAAGITNPAAWDPAAADPAALPSEG